MSLAESKHRLKLMPEISEAQTLLRSSQYNVSGKTVNAGSGVTINTNDVIYIENGPNYHTYTFSIVRESAPIDAPVENLVLTPLPDGTYKGLLFRYNFTQQERQNIMDGIPVDTKGKTTITEAGTNITLSKVQECSYVEETIWQDCSQHIHNQSNISDWVNCTAEIKPQVYTIGYWSCSSGGGGGNEGGSGNTGSDDGTGGGNAGNDNCITEVFQNPLDPVAVYNPCPIGVPTSPNIPNLSDPCEKTKNILNNPELQSAITKMKNQAALPVSAQNYGEIGYKFKADGTSSGMISGGKHEVELGPEAGYQGGYHNHPLMGIKMLSPDDIVKLLNFAMAQPNGNIADAFMGMIGTGADGTEYHYVIQYTGNIQELQQYLYNNNWNLEEIKDVYSRSEKELLENSLYINFSTGKLNNQGLEKLFFGTLKNMGLENKVNLQRIESNVIKNVTLNSNGTTTANSCPQN